MEIITPQSDNYSSKKAQLINEEKFGPYTFPFKTQLSFEPLIKFWRTKLGSEDRGEAVLAKEIMSMLEEAPELQKPIEDFSVLDGYDDLVELLLAGIFPSVLRDKQLGFAIPPFLLKGFYFTPRLSELLLAREIRFGFGTNPILTKAVSIARACAIILNKFYGQNIVIDPPFNFVMRPKGKSMERYYKSELYGDFLEIKQLKPLQEISQDEINRLLSNIYDTQAWLEIVPPTHFEFEGLVFANLIDVTEEESLSRIKHKLLENDALIHPQSIQDLQFIARNYFGVPDLRLGVKAFDYPMTSEAPFRYKIEHNFLIDSPLEIFDPEFENSVYLRLCRKNTIMVIEDLVQYHDPTDIEVELLNYGIRSLVIAPLNDDHGQIIGFLELGSSRPNGLNALNLMKISELIPLFEIAVERSREETTNRVQALIRTNYTHIHPSVEWKFISTAYKYLDEDPLVPLKRAEPIRFKQVFPLYGQSDVVSSSSFRNQAIRADYIDNLKRIQKILKEANVFLDLPLLPHYQWEIDNVIESLSKGISTSDEVRIYQFIHSDIHSILKQIEHDHPQVTEMVKGYFNDLDPHFGIVYRQRRDYEESLRTINNTIEHILEEEDDRAQKMIPHYFEKIKTDGYEFNIYVGQSIMRDATFTDVHLKNLRLWQLTTLCRIGREIAKIQTSLSCPMDTAQMVLAYPSAIDIRFRTDEKKFDVDGVYNMDFEIIKKRVDKAVIKGSQDRLRKAGHLSVVYMHESQRQEYQEYFNYLIKNHYLEPAVEHFEIEKLQDVEGLRALRVMIKVDDPPQLSKK